MRPRRWQATIGSGVGMAILAVLPAWAETETTELVTYFPSATANVEDLRARRGAIGESLYWDGLDKPTVQPVGTFLVQGPVTIGTTTTPPDISPTSLVVVSRPVTPSPPAAPIAEFLSPLGSDDQRAYLRVGATKPSDGATFGYRFHTTPGLAGAFIGDAQGAPLLTVLGSGHVGVGTTDPQRPLEVRGRAASGLVLLAYGTGAPAIADSSVAISSAFNERHALAIRYSNNAIGSSSHSALYIQHVGFGGYAVRVDDELNDTTPFVIDGAGLVGIGTANPVSPLTVVASSPPSGLQATDQMASPAAGIARQAIQGVTQDATGALTVDGAFGYRERIAGNPLLRAGVYGEAPRVHTGQNDIYAGYFKGDVKIDGTLEVTGGGPVRWVMLTSAPSNRRITLSCPSNYVLTGCGTNHIDSGDAGTEYIFTEMSQSRCVGYPAAGGQREHRYSLTITCVSGVEVRSPSNP